MARKTNTHIYTPRLKDTGERLRLTLNDVDWAVANRYRGTFRVRGVVTDQSTGKRYRIKGAACASNAAATSLRRKSNVH